MKKCVVRGAECGGAKLPPDAAIAPRGTYRCILADPPWPETMSGRYARTRYRRPAALPYPTMPVAAIAALPVGSLAAPDAHIWLWTTNRFLRAGFDVLDAWGARYLAPVHAIKPSGFGNYFVHRSQTLLFGYVGKCRFPAARFAPNLIHVGNPSRHSGKWPETYAYIERISPGPRIELFARERRAGWDAWGDEVHSDISLEAANA